MSTLPLEFEDVLEADELSEQLYIDNLLRRELQDIRKDSNPLASFIGIAWKVQGQSIADEIFNLFPYEIVEIIAEASDRKDLCNQLEKTNPELMEKIDSWMKSDMNMDYFTVDETLRFHTTTNHAIKLNENHKSDVDFPSAIKNKKHSNGLEKYPATIMLTMLLEHPVVMCVIAVIDFLRKGYNALRSHFSEKNYTNKPMLNKYSNNEAGSFDTPVNNLINSSFSRKALLK